MHPAKRLVLQALKPILPASTYRELAKPAAQRQWEREVLPRAVEFFKEFIDPGQLVFDIGAHAGDLALIFATCGAKVVAVEPQPWLAAEIRDRLGERVSVIELAMAAAEGEATLHIDDTGAAATLSEHFPDVLRSSKISDWFRARKYEKEITVRTTTLDALIARFGVPQFCKIDVEGFEDQVVAGLSQPLRSLSLEYTGEDLNPIMAALDRLESMGTYRFNCTQLGRYQLVLNEWRNGNGIREYLRSISTTIATGDVYAVRR